MTEPTPTRPGEAFPRHGVVALVGRLPAYARVALALSRDERIPTARRVALLGAAAYLFSPIDLVPGIIPLVGQVDDLLVIIVALRVALASLAPDQRLEVLERAGLSERDLEDDLATLAAAGQWLVLQGLRVGRTVARVGLDVGVGLTRAGVRAGLDTLRAIERRRRSDSFRQPARSR